MNDNKAMERDVARERISALLDYFGIDSSFFAASLAITDGYVSGILLGTKTPSKKVIRSIKTIFEVLDSWWETGEGEITERDPHQIINTMTGQNNVQKDKGKYVFLTPEFITVIDNLDAELEKAYPETRYTAVCLLNKYIRTGLIKDVKSFLGESAENWSWSLQMFGAAPPLSKPTVFDQRMAVSGIKSIIRMKPLYQEMLVALEDDTDRQHIETEVGS